VSCDLTSNAHPTDAIVWKVSVKINPVLRYVRADREFFERVGITLRWANTQHSRKFSSMADPFFGAFGFDGNGPSLRHRISCG
jgi:hypothetical protein